MPTNHFAYKGPGKYIAICNNSNFDGHHTKHFEIPATADEHLDELLATHGIFSTKNVPASWYFLNVVDFVACVEAVYPESIFK